MTTANLLIQRIRHALGGSPDSRLPVLAIINEAGRRMFADHQWTWRKRVVTWTLEADTNEQTLPDDYAGLISVSLPSTSSYSEVRAVTTAEIMGLRRYEMAALGVLYIAFDYAKRHRHGDSNQYPVALLNVAPDDEVSLTLTYLRNWVYIPDGDKAATVDIPEKYERLLILACRAQAFADQELESGKWEAAEAIYAAELDRMKREDAGTNPIAGQLTGGVDRYYSPGMASDPVSASVANVTMAFP